MGLDDLVDCIELLQERIRKHGTTLRQNETRTRMALIDPLLAALGWNIADPEVVTPEYEYKVSSGGNRWADYALLRPDGKIAATIEAKKLGTQLKGHRDQVLTHAIKDGIKYAGLTDGDNWEMYNIFQPVKLEEKRNLEVSLANDPAHTCALKLLLLWRPNLSSGEPVPAGEPMADILGSPQPESVEPDSPPRLLARQLEVESGRTETSRKRRALEKYLADKGYKDLFDRIHADLRRRLPEQGVWEQPGSTGIGFLLTEPEDSKAWKTYFGVQAGYLGKEVYSVSVLPQAITWGGDGVFARLRESVDLKVWPHGGYALSFKTPEEWDEIRPQVLEFVHAVLANRTNVEGPES